jgi:hypothetical protein
MRRAILAVVLVAMLVALAGCAAHPNPLVGTPNDRGEVAGFWRGLWHGIIAPITFIISLFSREVHFYEVHNNGGWYNLGFVIGAGILFGGGFLGGRKRHDD